MNKYLGYKWETSVSYENMGSVPPNFNFTLYLTLSLKIILALSLVFSFGGIVKAHAENERLLVLGDFESEEAVEKEVSISPSYQGNYKLSSQWASSGSHCLSFTAVKDKHKWPGITVKLPTTDWSKYAYLRFDALNEKYDFICGWVEVADNKSVEWYTKAEKSFIVFCGGKNIVKVPLQNLKVRHGARLIDLKHISSLLIRFYPFPEQSEELSILIDKIRLETEQAYDEACALEQQEEQEEIMNIENELEALKKASSEAYNQLQNLIEKARQKNIDTSYYEATEETARIGLEVRSVLPWFVRSLPKRKEIYNYVISSCNEAIENLQKVMNGKKGSLAVPPHPDFKALKRKGAYWYLGEEPKLLCGVYDGGPVSVLGRFFVPYRDHEWLPNLTSVFGGHVEAIQAKKVPMYQTLVDYPDSRRVSFQNGSIYIAELGKKVDVCLENDHSKEAIVNYLKKIKYINPKLHQTLLSSTALFATMGYEYYYNCYCQKSKEMFWKWLEKKYGNLASLNQRWKTNYATFQEIQPPYPENGNKDRALWYDWGYFNQYRFTDYLKWLYNQTKQIYPEIPLTVAGISTRSDLSSEYGISGVDMESIINEVSDVVNNEDGTPLIYTDLLRSFSEGKKPIINFESKGDVPSILPHFLHGDAANGIWTWYIPKNLDNVDPNEANVRDSIPMSWRFSLDHVEEALKTALDIRRLSEYIIQFPQAKREIALLYSKTTMLQVSPELVGNWQVYTPYLVELHRAYYATQFLDVFRDFISEKQIEEGKLAKYKILIMPGVSHLRKEIVNKILDYVKDGGTLLITPNSLLYDEYHHRKDYMNDFGIKIKDINSPPSVQPAIGHPSSIKSYLEKYFKAAGLLKQPGPNLKILDKDIFSGQTLSLGCLGTTQAIETDPSHSILAKFPDGSPAIVLTKYGEGEIYYFAAALAPKSLANIVDLIIEKKGINRPIRFLDNQGKNLWGVEARVLKKAEGKYLLYMYNTENETKTATLKANFQATTLIDLRTMEVHQGKHIELTPRETKLFLLRTYP